MAETIPAPLKGKVAVVTGGGRGIGKGITLTFARHGCTHIAITYASNKSTADDVVKAIHDINKNIKTAVIKADVRDHDFGFTVVKEALQGLQTDHIDIMVSNATLLDRMKWPPIAESKWENWDEIITTNAFAPLTLAQAVIGHMPRGGRIIMISSGASKIANSDPNVGYGAAKAALDSVSRSLASMWGPKYGITVNSISVGATLTEALKAGVEAQGPEFEKFISEFSMLKRIGEVQEVADIVAFVASPQAGWIIGNNVPANGGGLAMLQG